MGERGLRQLSKFDEYLNEGKQARLFGISTDSMDRDELIAAFGFMVKLQQNTDAQRRELQQFKTNVILGKCA